jgi:hypothetical protein
VATAGELTIILQAQDRASDQIRALGGEVQQLQRRTEAAGAGFGSRLAAGISGVADGFRLLGGAAEAVGGIIGAVADQIKQGFASNTELERATIAFQRYTGSAQAAADIVTALRREAAVSPFNDQEVIASGRALIGYAKGSTDQLLALVRVSEQLAALDPLQGISGGVVALQEALSGSFESLADRFEIPRSLIQRLRDEGVPNLEIVKRALEFRGIDTGAIDALGRSFEGRLSTIRSFGQELRQLVTAGPFRALTDVFGHLVELINRFGDQLRIAATAIGELFTVLAQRAVQALTPLLGFLDSLAPGLRELVTTEFGRPMEQLEAGARGATPEVERLTAALSLPQAREALRDAGGDLERLQALAARTAAPVAVINRELGGIGVKAAEIQLGADRIRQGYEDQLKPLERQLELLQNSVEVQRIQNALASNRAISERLRLERELQALQAAGGDVDPTAADLTPRQRAIALATQERRLQLEALNLQQQQGPAVQTLQERIAELRRREQEALDPSERLLRLYKDRVDVLQIESQRWQNLKGDIDAAAQAAQTAQDTIKRGGADEPAQGEREETARQRGEAVAKAWLDGFDKWIAAGGGTVWGAVGKSLSDWYDTNGKPLATRIGNDLGAALGKAASAAFEVAFAPQLESLERIERVVEFLTDPAGTIGRRLEQMRKEGDTRRDIATLPRVSPEAAGADTVTGGGPNVSVSVQVHGEGASEREARLQRIAEEEAQAMLRRILAAEAGTDPGPNQLLPGNLG